MKMNFIGVLLTIGLVFEIVDATLYEFTNHNIYETQPSQFEDFSDFQKTADWHELAEKLSNVKSSGYFNFRAKDNQGNALICLKVFQRKGEEGL